MTENLEQRAKDALGWVENAGIDRVGIKEPVEYGLSNHLYTQEQVDSAQRKYIASKRR